MSRLPRNTAENTDQNVLTIFLPLLAVALTVCAGACCYMEKKRKQKIKKGAAFTQDDHISDIESVISTSSRNRSYLLPSTTTGRSFRSASRTGSIRSYGGNSTYGEPPPYSGRASRRSSIASIKALEEDKFDRGRVNNGFVGSKRSLRRSRSLLDLNSEYGQAPLRRTRSSANMRRYSFQDNGSAFDRRSHIDDDEIMSQRSGRSGYPPSQHQERPRRQSRSQAPPHDTDYMYDRPSSVASLPNRGARSSMRRSASQPNLRNNINKTRTYPQGILKRNGAPSENGSKVGGSSVTGVPPSGGRPSSQLRGPTRSLTRLQAYGTIRGNYDRYANDNGINQRNFSSMQQGAFDGSAYNTPNSAAFPQYQQQQQGNGKAYNAQYPPSFDPYNFNDNYWEQGSAIHSQASQNPYGYGSMIY